MAPTKFADRVQDLAPSPIRQMMNIAKRLIGEGKVVHELNIGQPDVDCIEAFVTGMKDKASTSQINYSSYLGETCLRETFARYLNDFFDRRKSSHLFVETDNVLVTVGASHAICATFLAICNPGDEVLTFEPFFSPYKGFISLSGGVLKSIPTKASEKFALPPDEEIEKYITPKTKAIIFNSPNNPSGKIYSKDEVNRLARLCLKHNLYIVSDEVYREMILGDTEAYSLLQIEFDEPELNEKYKNHLVVIDSASKSFSLCGLRIGFVVARPHIVNKVSMIVAFSVACVSDISQYGVASAYDSVINDTSYLDFLRKTYRERLEATMQAIKEYMPDVIAPKPDGAFYLMIKFPQLEDISEFCIFMLEKFNLGGETVAVTPAETFYMTPGCGKNEIRAALVVSPEKMVRSIKIMSEAMKAYLKYKETDSNNKL